MNLPPIRILNASTIVAFPEPVSPVSRLRPLPNSLRLIALRGRFGYLNPALKEVWKDENTSEAEVFEGIIRVEKRRKRVRVIDLQQTIDLVPDDYSRCQENSHHNVILHFYLNGIRAEIIGPLEPAIPK